MQYMFFHQNFMRNLKKDFSMQNFALKVLILQITRKSVQNSVKLGKMAKEDRKKLQMDVFLVEFQEKLPILTICYCV